MRVKIFDKDWSEKEAESEREIIVETLVDRVKIVERAGMLSIVKLSPMKGIS